jgi:hypothetical protein
MVRVIAPMQTLPGKQEASLEVGGLGDRGTGPICAVIASNRIFDLSGLALWPIPPTLAAHPHQQLLSMTQPNSIKTDEKKQHFDDIYVAPSPVPFKERIIDALEYISDDHNRTTFNRLVRPWLESAAEAKGGPLRYLDLCCCFGNTTLAIAHQMTVTELRENWRDAASAESPLKPRALPLETAGIDISEPALDFTRRAGIFDETLATDLNRMDAATSKRAHELLAAADVLVSTAALVYLDLPTVETLVQAFASAGREGYAMVNFLNPFSLEKSDETKKVLLKHLDFVGSTATRHRRMSPLEQENYPGEEWSLLEIWVLKRRV